MASVYTLVPGWRRESTLLKPFPINDTHALHIRTQVTHWQTLPKLHACVHILVTLFLVMRFCICEFVWLEPQSPTCCSNNLICFYVISVSTATPPRSVTLLAPALGSTALFTERHPRTLNTHNNETDQSCRAELSIWSTHRLLLQRTSNKPPSFCCWV